jgi:hypothetical protein
MHGRTPLSARPHSILPHHIPKRRQRGIQRRTSIPRHHRIARPIIPPMQFPAFLGLPASLPVRCPKNEALSNSTPVTAVTSFENRQVHRSSQVCTLVSSPIHSVQIGAAPQIAPGTAPMRNSTHTVLGQSRAERDASLAEKDKCLAHFNKSRRGSETTKKREIRQQG